MNIGKPKIDPAELYRATTSFASLTSPDTKSLSVKQGAILRGSDPIVRDHPDLFILASLDDREAADLIRARHEARATH